MSRRVSVARRQRRHSGPWRIDLQVSRRLSGRPVVPSLFRPTASNHTPIPTVTNNPRMYLSGRRSRYQALIQAWRHLANMIEPSVCGGDVVLRQITLTTCYSYTINLNLMNYIWHKIWVSSLYHIVIESNSVTFLLVISGCVKSFLPSIPSPRFLIAIRVIYNLFFEKYLMALFMLPLCRT